MKREDFDSAIDWVIYKVNGRKPKETIKPQKQRVLDKHTLPKTERRYDLKFYYNAKNNRYAVLYDNIFLCACDENEIKDIQKFFDEKYNGNNIKKIQKTLKKKYNKKIQLQTYKDANMTFQSKKGGRFTARIQHKGKTYSICQCYENQKDDVIKTYDNLKKTHNLEQIQEIMKNQYNIQRKPNKTKTNTHQINLTEDGACYKDGKFCIIDPKIYSIVDAYLMKESDIK